MILPRSSITVSHPTRDPGWTTLWSPWMHLFFLVLLNLLALSGVSAQRVVTPLSDDWKFLKGEASLAADSSSWENIRVPHTWNALDGQSGPALVNEKPESEKEAEAAADARKAAKTNATDPRLSSGYDRGICWYEHCLDIPADWHGKKRVFARFGAAGTVARVYLNKTLLGEHRGGFTAFCFELPSSLIHYGVSNELRVQVDNSHREDLPPLSGDFNLDGGLYRKVELIVTGESCISPLDYASPGVYLTTKSLDAKQATVEVTTIVSNGKKAEDFSKRADKTPGAAGTENPSASAGQSLKSVVLTVRTELKDAGGHVVASLNSTNSVPNETSLPVSHKLTIADPHSWNGRPDPYLYTATVSLLRDGETIDQVSQPLGLRSVAITQDHGFLLNGKPYPVHGVNRHQDVRNKGWAISPEDEEKDAALMKEMGVTAVRNAHYPQSENWHLINDREGVLLWDEVSLVDTTRSSREFWRNSEEYLREMIHQLYNHPSIAWWGIFNELGNKEMPPSDEGLSRLQAVAKELDPDRLVVAASCHPNRSFNHVPEQIGLNAYPGWYNKTSPSSMADRIASFSKEVGKRIAVSEYGAGANIAHHAEGIPVQPLPGGPFHPEEWQAFVHEGEWGAMKDNPNLWGSFVWNMFDFACKRRDEGNTPSLNDKGLITHDRRIRKDAFFLYKANWNPEPMVHITASRMTPRKLAVTEVKVYSNCDEVTLSVNGQKIVSTHPDAIGVCRFRDVTLLPGRNLIEVTGTEGGTTVRDSCSWILETGVSATPPPQASTEFTGATGG